jgi:CHAT domain-containing protein/tetratricopeptide (TPR) repeat protein
MPRKSPFALSILALTMALSSGGEATALTKDQATERCRNSVGRPIVMQCMRSGRGDRPACRQLARPKVQACIRQALAAANRRANVPVEVPKNERREDSIEKQAAELRPAFVAPPRTISDITALLDGEKPDAEKIAKIKSEADASPPAKASREALARFYYQRGTARAELGRLEDAIADAEAALKAGRGAVDANLLGRLWQFAALQYAASGDPKKALETVENRIRDADTRGGRGHLFHSYRQMTGILLQMGELARAEQYLQRNLALIETARTSGMPGWRKGYATAGQSWESEIDLHRAIMFEARGEFQRAEGAYRQAELRRRAMAKDLDKLPNPPPLFQVLQSADALVLAQARVKARQGRFVEAEAYARRALLSRLKAQGKYHPATIRFVLGLANVLVAQGRYAEAEKLIRAALQVASSIGVPSDTRPNVRTLTRLASVLNLQHKRADAAAIHADIDRAIARWEPKFREPFELNPSRILSLYSTNEIDRGIAAAEAMVKREIARGGEQHYDTAVARGFLGIGYMKAHRGTDAARQFRAAIPVLMDAERNRIDDDDNPAEVDFQSHRLQSIVESHIALLARMPAGDRDQVAAETFSLADAVRSTSVQHALTAANARLAAQDDALGALVRREQDLNKQVSAQFGALNNALSLPAAERNEDTIKVLQASIGNLRAEQDETRLEMAKRFPAYADLVKPKPPTVEDVKASLRSGEALLSFYFGREQSFVWAISKTGIAFSQVPVTAQDLEAKVRKLREALEPQAETVGDIPKFDLALAYELYSRLLKPVESIWKPASALIVVTNGALGQLPLSVLPTAPAQVSDREELPFSDYRNVPWLARTHAVTAVPSAAALRTLRQLPADAGMREQFIGFGDPVFSSAQAAERDEAAPVQMAAVTTRGLPLRLRSSPDTGNSDGADLGMLPALPDTAEELTSIAHALQEDPARVLHLGRNANEKVVKSAPLSRYRIVVFATHGLVPGDLSGLTQPALALTAPDVAGVEGDGLLTMEEVLALKLNADWVVLSACNTGSGAGAGAEAASGLGRAFFYAGSRALLLTNWSVHSQSARDLTTDLFLRQRATSRLSRGEALRQAMMALVDGRGYVDEDGKTRFTYAHPLFWAPYTLIGDGGV